MTARSKLQTVPSCNNLSFTFSRNSGRIHGHAHHRAHGYSASQLVLEPVYPVCCWTDGLSNQIPAQRLIPLSDPNVAAPLHATKSPNSAREEVLGLL